MTTLFISDLHLDASRPRILELFAHFIATEARNANAVYILGDLFETWIGDDDDSALASMVANVLHGLSEHGVPLYFMPGNRDFLLGPAYAARCGMRILDDASVIDLYGTPTLLVHGDTLCTDDVEYQKFRAEVRSETWQQRFLAQPLATRRAFAGKAREASRAHVGDGSSAIMDVNQDAVMDAMQAHQVRHMIHGHTHRPAVHALQVNQQAAERIVLGDWYEQGSVLRVDASRRQLDMLANIAHGDAPRMTTT